MNPPPKGRIQGQVPYQQASGQDLKAQAVGNFGKAVKGVGDLALELQLEQDRQYTTDAELIMRRKATEIAGEIATNMNPSSHAEIASKKFDSAIDGILKSEGLRPSLQQDLRTRLEMFKSAKVEKISQDAKIIQLENGRRLSATKTKLLMDEEDFDGARANVRSEIGTYRTEEEAEALLMEIDQTERRNNFDLMARQGDIDGIEASDLSESAKEKYLQSARVSRSRIQRQAMTDVMDEAERKGVKTEEEMKSILERSNLDESAKEKILYHWSQNQPVDLETKRDLMKRMKNLTMMRKNGFISEKEYEEEHHAIGLDVYALGSREGSGTLRKEVYARDPNNWKEGNLMMGQEKEAAEQLDDVLDIWERHKKKSFGDDFGLEQELGTNAQRQQLEDEMQTWLAKNKDLIGTPEFQKELNKELRRKSAKIDMGGILGDSDWNGNLDDILGSEGAKGPQGVRAKPFPETTMRKSSKGFKVFNGSRDQFRTKYKSWNSSAGNRKLALDFNDEEPKPVKKARGIEIILPRDATSLEIRMSKEYCSKLQKWYASKGVKVPVRHKHGVHIGGGKKGVIHTEPFFAADTASRDAIANDPAGYAKVLATTLGNIPGVTFIAPHTKMGAKDKYSGPGAQSGKYSERSFALEHILPELMKY